MTSPPTTEELLPTLNRPLPYSDEAERGVRELTWYLKAKVEPQFRNPPGFVPVAANVAAMKTGVNARSRTNDSLREVSIEEQRELGVVMYGTPDQVAAQIKRPFWIDTVGKSALVEIRIQLDNNVMRVFAKRSAAHASNSEIFLLWMVGTSLVLLTVAILFLRNQIRPILRLADAAESFGKGREAPNFKPRGAREVRRALRQFLERAS